MKSDEGLIVTYLESYSFSAAWHKKKQMGRVKEKDTEKFRSHRNLYLLKPTNCIHK